MGGYANVRHIKSILTTKRREVARYMDRNTVNYHSTGKLRWRSDPHIIPNLIDFRFAKGISVDQLAIEEN